jgi:hypothetical protein
MATRKTAVDRSKLPPTFDHLQKRKKPIEARTTVFLDDEPIHALNAARDELEKATTRADATRRMLATTGGDPEQRKAALDLFDADTAKTLAPLRKAVEAAEQAVRESSIECVFRSIGRTRFDELRREHPPTDEDRATAEAEGAGSPQWHPDSFEAALVAESAVVPKMTAEQADSLREAWNEQEWLQLFIAALSCNSGRRTAELGKARG